MPETLTQLMLDNIGKENEYKGLLNANFQDYMDGLAKTGELQIGSAKVKQKFAALGSGMGLAAGALGGPAGLALGFAIGNQIGKYAGNVMSDKIYGRAIADMSTIMHDAKLRHAQIAASYSLNGKMLEAIDTLRQNANKRTKDDLQSMAV
ncbi:MAG: hypothetical protein HYR97_04545 [Candidatus Melainabacteria bacterium]|nr:hypothetical protein [Candidatus Melainabacteria bacterium]